MKEIEKVKKLNKKYKIDNELNYLENIINKNDIILDKINTLKSEKNESDNNITNLNNHFTDEIYNSMFRKDWNDLLPIHKEIKIKEYLKKKNKYKKKIYKKIIDLKKKQSQVIEYDKNIGIIKNINLSNCK